MVWNLLHICLEFWTQSIQNSKILDSNFIAMLTALKLFQIMIAKMTICVFHTSFLNKSNLVNNDLTIHENIGIL